MKAICPNDRKHNTFLAVAHVTQTWKIDDKGSFVEEVSTDEVIHSPDFEDNWVCATCGESAVFE